MAAKRPKRIRRSYFPRRFRRYHKKKMTVPIAPVIGMVTQALSNGVQNSLMQGDWNGAMTGLKWNYLGIDANGNFNGVALVTNWTPTIVGMAAHIAANKFGLNRILAKNNVPYVRI